jgi:arginine utilization regulatory protein
MNYKWPGNVREMQHVIEGAISLARDEQILELEHLPYYLEHGERHTMEIKICKF